MLKGATEGASQSYWWLFVIIDRYVYISLVWVSAGLLPIFGHRLDQIV